jgi:hypothetical protein
MLCFSNLVNANITIRRKTWSKSLAALGEKTFAEFRNSIVLRTALLRAPQSVDAVSTPMLPVQVVIQVVTPSFYSSRWSDHSFRTGRMRPIDCPRRRRGGQKLEARSDTLEWSISRSSHTTKLVGNDVRTPGAIDPCLPITMLCFRNFVNAKSRIRRKKRSKSLAALGKKLSMDHAECATLRAARGVEAASMPINRRGTGGQASSVAGRVESGSPGVRLGTPPASCNPTRRSASEHTVSLFTSRLECRDAHHHRRRPILELRSARRIPPLAFAGPIRTGNRDRPRWCSRSGSFLF